jgi:sulfatase maturation enzyme AslB (radical SAM superfamily)
LENHVEEIVRDFSTVQVSLDGTEKSNDLIRKGGHFKKTVEGIIKLKKIAQT